MIAGTCPSPVFNLILTVVKLVEIVVYHSNKVRQISSTICPGGVEVRAGWGRGLRSRDRAPRGDGFWQNSFSKYTIHCQNLQIFYNSFYKFVNICKWFAIPMHQLGNIYK